MNKKFKHKILKYKTDVAKMFESDYGANKKTMKNKKNKTFLRILEKELTLKYEELSQKFDCLDSLEGIGSMGWFFCNEKYKEMPSSIHVEAKYNLELLDYLRENSKTVYRRIYDADDYAELQYIFFYKECFITLSVSFNSEETNSIQGFGVYHQLCTTPDYSEFNKFLFEEEEVPKIGIIKTTRHGPAVTYIDHKTDYKFNYNNYNEDFSSFFEDLKVKLTGDVKTGLYLFYGDAGTGKSSAIRHLITEIDRPVVFIPPQMINCLSSPDFTDLVTGSLKNSILVIEDAEKALMKRESEDGFFNSELVSSVLNLTDGLYADLAQTAIIATYNCNRNLVDPALLRKGRLRSEYHFKKLSIDRSQQLMDTLGHECDVEEEMSLADIFNYQKQYSNKVEEKKRSVGFGG